MNTALFTSGEIIYFIPDLYLGTYAGRGRRHYRWHLNTLISPQTHCNMPDSSKLNNFKCHSSPLRTLTVVQFYSAQALGDLWTVVRSPESRNFQTAHSTRGQRSKYPPPQGSYPRRANQWNNYDAESPIHQKDGYLFQEKQMKNTIHDHRAKASVPY